MIKDGYLGKTVKYSGVFSLILLLLGLVTFTIEAIRKDISYNIKSMAMFIEGEFGGTGDYPEPGNNVRDGKKGTTYEPTNPNTSSLSGTQGGNNLTTKVVYDKCMKSQGSTRTQCLEISDEYTKTGYDPFTPETTQSNTTKDSGANITSELTPNDIRCSLSVSSSSCFCTTSNCYWNDNQNNTYSVPRSELSNLQNAINGLSDRGLLHENYSQLSFDVPWESSNIPLNILNYKYVQAFLQFYDFLSKLPEQNLTTSPSENISPEINNNIYNECMKNHNNQPVCEFIAKYYQPDNSTSEIDINVYNECMKKYNNSVICEFAAKAAQPENIMQGINTDDYNECMIRWNNRVGCEIYARFAQSENMNGSNSPNLIYYSQNDPLWANILIGNTSFFQLGCGETVLASLLASYINPSWTPISVYETFYQNNPSWTDGWSSIYFLAEILNQYGFNPTENRLGMDYFGQIIEAGNLGLTYGYFNNFGGWTEHITLITQYYKDANGVGHFILQDPYINGGGTTGKLDCTRSGSGDTDYSCETQSGNIVNWRFSGRYVLTPPIK